ncbi:MFS family major facilitator transporter [Ligilactobacillus hayakitensis DSM 18933 = JCM 14209]|uniref:MFS family major facilitator transporter n=1 Tax=Ligilactobacillus hayakitensis DSM 18933 = JCM 14209 TaxID=1423755 RepID=A0A0R1WR26_9LACO|nr:MFS transporter [Ligilactobacillus hayakitensis]KRM20065.1 MFS family major facilitator transporter [Ligilactobacillus hayakitensis DSM 18933 = JCM 14209]
MEKVKSKNIYVAIFSAAIVTFLGILNETSMNVTYPTLVKEFNIPLSSVQWITTGYLLTVTIMMGTTAYLLRQFKARYLHLAATLMFTLGIIICATTNNFGLMMVGRVIQGMATGITSPIMFHLIFTQIPRNKLGVMTGMAGMVISFAPALGPTYGGAVLGAFGWRMIFWLLIPLIIIAMILGQIYIRTEATGNDKPFSYLAFVLMGISLVSFIYGMSLIGSIGFALKFWLFMLSGLVFGAAFIFTNNHGKSQLLHLGIFLNPSIALAGFTYFCLQFINIGLSVAIPVYSQYALGASSLLAGFILLPGSVIGAFSAPIGGHVADNYGPKRPIMLGISMIVLGTLGFILTQNLLTPMFILGIYIIVRVGFNISFANTMSNATTLVDHKHSSDVNSSFNVLQQFAGSLGVSIATAIISINQKNGVGSIAHRTFIGGKYVFMMFFFLAFCAFIAIILNFKHQSKNK